jgi:hypothetical protein
VTFADADGQLLAKNSQKIQAKITGEDWHSDAFSVAIGAIDNESAPSLVKFNNGVGGLNEKGEVIDGASVPTTAHHRYAPSNDTKGSTQSLVGVPATPGGVPLTTGTNYKPVSYSYNIHVTAISSATYYEIYESPNDSNYQRVYSGSAGSVDLIKHRYGYQYYKYKACNTAGCSGFSPWRRLYVYTAPGVPKPLSISPLNVAPNTNYTVAWGHAGGDVDGTLYSVYESLNGGSESMVYSVPRVHWSEPGYSFTTTKPTSGSYRYRIQGCSPNAGCGGFATVYQTVVSPNTKPDTTADSASVSKNSYITIDVLANDTDAQGQALTVSIYSQPANGSLAIINNMIRYTPNSNFYGNDSFYYQAIDTGGLYSDATPVYLTVDNVMGQPSLSRVASPNMLAYTMAWNGQSGATRYELHERKDNGGWSLAYTGVSTSMVFIQPLLADYDYRVRACDNTTCSSWSAIIAAMTLKATYATNDHLGTPVMHNQQSRGVDKTKYSYPFGQQENKQ